MEIPQKVARIILYKQCNTCVFPVLKEPQNTSSAAVFDHFCVIWVTVLRLGLCLDSRWRKKASDYLFSYLRSTLKSTSIDVTINSAAAQICDVPQLMGNILAWLPQPPLPVPVGGLELGAKEKKKKKTGCGYTVTWQQRHIDSNLLI